MAFVGSVAAVQSTAALHTAAKPSPPLTTTCGSGGEEVDISKSLFGFCGEESAGFDEVLALELAEARQRAEVPEAVSSSSNEPVLKTSADAVYGLLGGETDLVQPVLAGKRLMVCAYGRRCGRHAVLREVAVQAIQEMAKQAEQLASVKLFSLRAAFLECNLNDADANVVFDHLGQQIVDAAGITGESIQSIMKPISPETLQELVGLISVRPRSPQECSGHFVFQLEAAHANEVGCLTVVSVASLEKIGKRWEDIKDHKKAATASQDLKGAAVEHLASLKRLGRLMATFTETAGGPTRPCSGSSSLLLLAPPSFSQQSHFGLMLNACRCQHLEHNVSLMRPALQDPQHLLWAVSRDAGGAVPPGARCTLPSPPGSDCSKSWGSGSPMASHLSSPSAPPALVPMMVGPSSNGVKSGGLGLHRSAGSASRLPAVPLSSAGPLISQARNTASTVGVPPLSPTGTAVMHSVSAQSPRMHAALVDAPSRLIERLSLSQFFFDSEDWLQRMRDEGRTSQEQIQDLLQVINRQQLAHCEVVELVRGFLQEHISSIQMSMMSEDHAVSGQSRLSSTGNSFPTPGSLNTGGSGYQSLPRSRIRVEGPAFRSTSPPLSLPLDGSGMQGPYGSPRRQEVKTMPVRQSSTFSEMAPQGPPSPLTRSRSANLHVSTMHRGPLAVQTDCPQLIPLSPQVPYRDPSPTRSRSVMQSAAGLAVTATLPLQGSSAQRGLVPTYPSGPSLQSGHLQTFPPPVQVPGTTAPVSASPPSAGGMDTVLPSPRRNTRASDDGVWSPPPAPPQGYPQFKQLESRTPNSARSGFVVGNMTWQAQQQQPVLPQQDSRLPSDSRSLTIKQRWEQASPCRVRFVGAGASSSGTVSSSATTSNRSVLGPPPKAGPAIVPQGPRPHSSGDLGQWPVMASPMQQALLGIASKPTAKPGHSQHVKS